MSTVKSKSLDCSRLWGRIGLIILALAGTAPAQAGDPAGRVVDQKGTGVAGVTVWAIGRSVDQPELSAQATTDNSGRFTLPGVWKFGAQKWIAVSFFARAADARCGWISLTWSDQSAPEHLTIALSEVGEVSGRLIDESGKPIAGCEVLVNMLERWPGRMKISDAMSIPAPAAQAYTARTAADGRFSLGGIPPGARIRAVFHAQGNGSPEVCWISTAPVTISLDRRLGAVSGRFTTADPRGLVGTIQVALRLYAPLRKGDDMPFQVLVFRTITMNRDGTFQIEDLPPGRYMLTPQFSADALFSAQPVGTIEVKPGASIKVPEIALVRTPLITGRVIDEMTGQGIAGVGVRAYQVRSDLKLLYVNQGVTDSSGNYKVAVDPGTVMIHPAVAPGSHMGLVTKDCPRHDVKGDRTWPDLKLARALAIDGVVLDPSGKPVSGAEVCLVVPDKGWLSNEPPESTQPNGSFHLQQLDTDDLVLRCGRDRRTLRRMGRSSCGPGNSNRRAS